MIGIPDRATMDMRIEDAQTQQPKEIIMSQLAFRSDAHLDQAGEKFRRTLIGWVRALWQEACRQAERTDRFVPYC